MDFKFNFGGEESESTQSNTNTPNIPTAPALQIYPNTKSLSTSRPIEQVTFKGLKHTKEPKCLKKYSVKAGESSGKLAPITNHSDLEPGVYEGGFKLWECAVDLVNYLYDCEIDFTNKTVLEIGCGHGLPGIYALHKGAQSVYFLDYNEEVLVDLTIPNVNLNVPLDGLSRSSFISGDWALVDELLGNIQFDIVLTADTLYSPLSYPKLYNLIQHHLKPDGCAYVAAKKYYFGVSGSTHLFMQEINEKKLFQIKSVQEIRDGVSNVREIIYLTH